MTKKYQNIVIDTNNLFWRAFCVNAKKVLLKESDKKFHIYIGAIEESIKKINFILNKFAYKSSKVYFLFDNPTSKINLREIISEGKYKHPRSKKKISRHFYSTINIFVEILKHYSDNYYIVRRDKTEADDLTKPIRNLIKPTEDNRILFISADLDWARNIEKNCHWWNWLDVYTREVFYDKFGFNPEGNAVKLYKAIHGDSSDNIQNAVPYLPKELLLDIIRKFKNVDDLLQGMWYEDYSKEWKCKIKEAEVQLKINYQLVDFIDIEESIEDYISNSKENLKLLKLWYNILEIPEENRMIKERKRFFQKKKLSRIK